MIVSDRIDIKLTISDINEIYVKDYDQMILNHAKMLYEHKCMEEKYIYKIIKIIKRSMPNIIKRDLNDCKININVVLEVEAIKYDTYDIIVGTKVVELVKKGIISTESGIICENDHAKCFINNSNILSNIQKNQLLPIIVGKVGYQIQKNVLVITAYPFIPINKENKVFKINTLTKEDIQYLNTFVYPKLDLILEKKQQLIKDKQILNRWNYFDELLYPYKNNYNIDNTQFTVESIRNTNITNYIILNYRHHLSKLEVLVPKKIPNTFISESAINAYEGIIIEFIKYIDVINQLSITYLDDNIFKSHQNIFNIYKDNKYE